jgi:hypothetical protein
MSAAALNEPLYDSLNDPLDGSIVVSEQEARPAPNSNTRTDLLKLDCLLLSLILLFL